MKSLNSSLLSLTESLDNNSFPLFRYPGTESGYHLTTISALDILVFFFLIIYVYMLGAYIIIYHYTYI